VTFRHVACETAHNGCGPTPKETGCPIYANPNSVFVSENTNQLRYVSKCSSIMSNVSQILLPVENYTVNAQIAIDASL
jgi:hypothetical protein